MNIKSVEGVVFTKSEWSELLDEYNLNDLQDLYWSLFDKEGRRKMNSYFKKRLKEKLK